MTKEQKIKEIKSLEIIVKEAGKNCNWPIYNMAVDRIGELNRSMRNK